MALLLAFVLLAVPVAELAVLVAVAGTIGVGDTVALVVLVSIAGVWLAKRAGLKVLTRVQAALGRGEVPSREVADGALVLLAGVLLIVPGFLSDGVALLLLLPPTRAAARGLLLRGLTRRSGITLVAAGPPFGAGRAPHRSGEVWDAESWEDAGPPARAPLEGPR
jgi:UPF0716 protein FxsA